MPVGKLEQLRILTRQPDGSHKARLIYGETRAAQRQRLVSDGANLPTGGTTFLVNRGTVALDDLIQYDQQTFKVAGIDPDNEFRTKHRITTNQQPGAIEGELPLPLVFLDGEAVTVDGEEVGVI